MAFPYRHAMLLKIEVGTLNRKKENMKISQFGLQGLYRNEILLLYQILLKPETFIDVMSDLIRETSEWFRVHMKLNR